jgi:hypothetical protein
VHGAVPAALRRRSAPRGGLDRGGVVERTAEFEAGHAEPAPTVTGCLGNRESSVKKKGSRLPCSPVETRWNRAGELRT